MFALKIYNQPNLLLESSLRTELLTHLISQVEKNHFKKFKIYHSTQISIKQMFEVSKMELGTFESRLHDDDLDEKQEMIQELMNTKLKDVMKDY